MHDYIYSNISRGKTSRSQNHGNNVCNISVMTVTNDLKILHLFYSNNYDANTVTDISSNFSTSTLMYLMYTFH